MLKPLIMKTSFILLVVVLLSGCVNLEGLRPHYWQDDMGKCHSTSKNGGTHLDIGCDYVPESALKFKNIPR